tara:strand:+ start:1487 stop:3991 length:2505 start_codon:yes stop_codon:yes gene_type:complete
VPYSVDLTNPQIPDFALDSTLQALIAQQSDTVEAIQRMASVGKQTNSQLEYNDNTAQKSVNEQKRSNIFLRNQNKLQQNANRNNDRLITRLITATRDLSGNFIKRGLEGGAAALRAGDMSQVLNYMGKLGVGLQGTISLLGDYRKSIRNLTEVGYGFGKSILQTQETLTANQLTLSEFERVVTRNGAALNFLGKGGRGAASEFSELSKTIRNSMKDQGNFGLSISQINDFLAENLDAEMRSGATRQEATDRLASTFNNLVAEATGLAFETGRQRKDLIKTALDAQRDERVLGKIKQLELQGREEEANIIRQNLKRLSVDLPAMFGTETGGMLLEAFVKSIETGRGIEADPIVAKLLSVGGVGADQLRDMSLAISSQLITSTALNKAGKNLEQRMGDFENIGVLASGVDGEGFDLLRKLSINFKELTGNPAETIKNAAEGLNEGTIALLQTEEAFNKVMTSAQGQVSGFTRELVQGLDPNFLSKTLTTMSDTLANTITNAGLMMRAVMQGDFGAVMSLAEDSPGVATGLGFGAAAVGAGTYGVAKKSITGAANLLGYKTAGAQGLYASQQLSAAFNQSGISIVGDKVMQYGKEITPKNGVYQAQSGNTILEFTKKGKELVPSAKSIMSYVKGAGAKTGILGAGVAATDAFFGFQNIDKSFSEREKGLSSMLEGASGPEKQIIEKKLGQLKSQKKSAQVDLIDKLIMQYGGAAVGALLGTASPIPGAGIVGGVTGYMAGEKGYESGMRPLSSLLETLGITDTTGSPSGTPTSIEDIKKRIQVEKEVEAQKQAELNNPMSDLKRILEKIDRKLGNTEEGYLSKLNRPSTRIVESAIT